MRTASVSFPVLASLLFVAACSKKEEPTSSSAASASATAAPPAPPAPPAAAPSATGPKKLDCKDDSQWKALDVKHLEAATIEEPAGDFEKAALAFVPCDDGKKHCRKATLDADQTVLAVGVHGSDLKIAIHDACAGGRETVSVALLDAAPRTVLRGREFVFESAVLGGDRLLVGGHARVPSEKTGTGFFERDYLLTTREAETVKIEVARNKQKFVPHVAASQFVQVRGPSTCTTQFWKLGVDQCDLVGPDTNDFVLFGQNLVYADPATKKGMAWKPKGEAREVLPSLDWIVGDGVNLAWSAEGALYSAQPKWDLPELVGAKAAGVPGPKPLAFGCGRLLTRSDAGWLLRDVKKGVEWQLGSERFPETVADDSSIVMNCTDVLVRTEKTLIRVSLNALGTSSKVPESADAPAPAPSIADSSSKEKSRDTEAPALEAH